MTKRPYLVLNLLVLLLFIFFLTITRNDLLKNVIMQNVQGFITDFNNKTLKNNLISLKNADCRTLLLQYRSMSLDDQLLESLTENCFEPEQRGTGSIFNKQFLEAVFGNTSCPQTKPKFLNESGPLVALASFPGSGNTWARILLETISGIHTGSLYKDTMANFSGSKRCPTKAGVLVVKTHKSLDLVSRPGCPKNIKFSRAIFILRNPYDAILAEYNRRKGGKVGFADRIAYTKDKWRKFVDSYSSRWKAMALFWLTKFDRQVHTLVYEDLKTNTMFETYRLMDFLNLNVTLQNLYCLVNKPHNRYYRAEKPDWLTKTELFSSQMKERINSIINSVYLNVNKTSKNADILKSYILSHAKYV